MSTEFISIQPPPGATVARYDRQARHDSQHDSHIPPTFLEAMSVREAVYVDEQKVPLENEFDDDDHRSFHWVTYVSVGQSASSANNTDKNDERGSTASRLAVGTIRIVPPPHLTHEQQDTKLNPSEENGSEPVQTEFNPHGEPYVKVGRLAVIPAFRKLGLAKLLLDSALDWASKHPFEVVPPLTGTDRETRKMEGETTEGKERWKGLVLAHAQKSIEGLYRKWGWQKDEAMGEWDEEGITHIAMWKRLPLRD